MRRIVEAMVKPRTTGMTLKNTMSLKAFTMEANRSGSVKTLK
jgi:hypothetical protein